MIGGCLSLWAEPEPVPGSALHEQKPYCGKAKNKHLIPSVKGRRLLLDFRSLANFEPYKLGRKDQFSCQLMSYCHSWSLVLGLQIASVQTGANGFGR